MSTIERRDPKPGEVWRSRVAYEEKRTVLVLAVPEPHIANGRVRTKTLTTVRGRPPERATRTSVLRSNWNRTFTYDRPATPEELQP